MGAGGFAVPRPPSLLSRNSVSQFAFCLPASHPGAARRFAVSAIHEPEPAPFTHGALCEGEACGRYDCRFGVPLARCMKHFGIISPPVSGHIHPFAALGRELLARGHRVTCFQMADLEEKIRDEGIDYRPIGLGDHPVGSLPRSLRRLGQLSGVAALRFTIRAVERTSIMMCRDGPAAIKAAGIDALLVDQ